MNEQPDEYTAVIKVSKEEKSQKIFLHFGAFVKDSSGNIVFRFFQKQQLIDFGVRPIGYIENDYSDIKMQIFDKEDLIEIESHSIIHLKSQYKQAFKLYESRFLSPIL
jgi:hypothetical protein